ncbi:MAG: DUF2961 domain-containing protein [Mariniphaga sp.]|nr:DUF2961 domain-containing protein [Mariniphaga sp.]
MKLLGIKTIFLLSALLVIKGGFAQPVVTTATMFENMADMEKLIYTPEPNYKTIQFSSYDRTSKIPNGPGWFANSDGFGGEPAPNFEMVLKEVNNEGIGEYLMLDVDGPGAIVRLWTARINGNLKAYVDNMEKPLYEGNAEEFFRHTYSVFPQVQEIDIEQFEKTVYQRDASYAPVVFSKRLRIEWVGKVEDLHFYEIEVKLFKKETSARSFTPDDISEFSTTINKVTGILKNPDKNYLIDNEAVVQQFTNDLNATERKEILVINRQKAIVEFTIKLEAENSDLALRQTVLHISYDNSPWGQVQSPVGDFFGAAPGINPYVSMPFSVLPNGTMKCRFTMPFKKNCKIVLENLGNQKVKASGSVTTIPYIWNENSMYFTALWRADHNIKGSNTDVMDMPYILTFGEGVYVGTGAYLLNTTNVPTPWGNWWGEGDEKIFVDNETFPSFFGTGSEDYFNYSWSSPDIFLFPYCGQPRNDGPGNRGFVTNYRWHIADPIPFKNNIRFYMELFTHLPVEGFSYARIGYHYAKPGATNNHLPIQPEDVRELKLNNNWKPVASHGSRNSVFYTAEKIISSKENIEIQQSNLWEGGNLMAWHPTKPGDKKDFVFDIDNNEPRNIFLTAALTPNSGKVNVYIDDKKVNINESGEIDLYRDYRTLLRNYSLGSYTLVPGKHKLTIEFTGCKENIEKPEIGIDFIWVQNPGN